MTIEEIIKIREDFENVKEDILGLAGNMYEKVDSILSCMKRAERQEQKISQEEFAKWIEKGITVGAEIEDIEDVKIPYPAQITGISCDGFIMTDASGKEYVLFSRCLKFKYKIKENDQKKRLEKLEKALKEIAEFQPAEYYESGGECNICNQMIDIAQEALKPDAAKSDLSDLSDLSDKSATKPDKED